MKGFGDPRVVGDACNRLRRIQGQVGGILAMIEEGRDCREVIQQIAAASRALDRVGAKLLVSQLQLCLGDETAIADAGDATAELERLFLTLT